MISEYICKYPLKYIDQFKFNFYSQKPKAILSFVSEFRGKKAFYTLETVPEVYLFTVLIYVICFYGVTTQNTFLLKIIFYLPKDLNYKDIRAPSAIENIEFCQMIRSTNL